MQQGFPVTIQNAGEFFKKTDPVHQALADISKRLEKEGIDYALIGGMARISRIRQGYSGH
jgi:hypothetical protein